MNDKIVIVVNIYQAVKRKQHFGMIENAFIRLVDARNNKEMCKYNLTENYSGMTAMIFGEIYRYNGEWKFNAIGNGTKDPGLGELCQRFVYIMYLKRAFAHNKRNHSIVPLL